MSLDSVGLGDCSALCPVAFRDIPQEKLKELHQSAKPACIEPGEILILGGTQSGTVYWIKAGLIKLTDQTVAGKSQTFSLCGPGRLVGIESILRRSAPLTSEAILRTHCCAIPGAVLREAIERLPQVSFNLLEYFHQEIENIYNRITTMSHYSTELRLISLLRELSASGSMGDLQIHKRVLELSLTQSEIAEILGTSRVSVSKAINSLRRAGLIEFKNKVFYLVNPELLFKMLSCEAA